MESVSTKSEGNGVAKVNIDAEINDCTTLGQSLIKFMNLATGTVKTALQKPANYKKNINHRRYLQKQLKICTRRKKRGPKTKTGSKPKKASPESAGTLPVTDVWMGQENPRQMDTRTLQENTFLSYERSFQNVGVFSSLEYAYHDFSNLRNSTNRENGFFASNSAIPGQDIQDLSPHMNNTTFLYTDELLPDVLVEADNFLTGEELTRSLDIKDLFVPERIERLDDINAFSYSPNDESYACNGFQTIPSTTDILSW